MQLWETAIYSILKYGLCALKIRDAMMVKLQQFTSKCIRDIVGAGDKEKQTIQRKTETSAQWKEKRKTNVQIRRDEGTPTIVSKIYGWKLRNIYRWCVTKAETVLNNQNELNGDINYLKICVTE